MTKSVLLPALFDQLHCHLLALFIKEKSRSHVFTESFESNLLQFKGASARVIIF